MATKKQTDQFAQIAYMAVTETAADTLTFAQLQLANNLLSEKAAIIIHRVEIFADLSATLLNTGNDSSACALVMSDRVTDITDLSQPEVIFFRRYRRIDFGTAASAIVHEQPDILDFSNLPGTGIIIPADRLYIGSKGNGEGAAATFRFRLWYTVKPLEVADYWDLIEARRVMTS